MGALALGLGFTACENLEDELADANTTIENLEGDLSALRAQLSEANSDIAENGALISSLNENLAAAATMLEAAEATIEGLEGDNAAQVALVAELRAQLESLAAMQADELAELAAAQAALASANADETAALEARIAELQGNIASLSSQLQELMDNPIIRTITNTVRVLADAEYSEWAPAFVDQQADFTQTRTVTVTANGGVSLSDTESREITVSSALSTETSNEAELDMDINNDGDLLDDVSREVTTFTASNDLGSFPINGEYSVSQDNDAPVVDETAPIITVLGRTASFSVDRTAGFTSPIEFRSHNTNSNEGVLMLNGEVFDAATQIVGLAAGTHTYVFTATDEAGNSSELTLTIEVAAAEQTEDPADTPGAWSYSYAGGSDANWAAGEIDLAGNTMIESFSGVRTRIWTINGERDASTPSNLNASNQEVETKQIRNTAYVAPDPADDLSAFSAWTPVATPDTQEFLNEERTRTFVQNGDLDAEYNGVVPSLVETRNDVTANPNYVAPITGTVTINAFAADSGFGFTGAAYTVLSVAGPNGAVSLNGQSFDFDGAGTYAITFGITGGTMLTVDLVIDAADDAGAYNITGPAASISITKQ